MLTIEEKILVVVAALEDIKANDISVLDTSKKSQLFERIVIASANSARQTRSLADHVSKQLKLRGEPALSVEGVEGGEWVWVDLGEVVVHIMQPAVRTHYQLEELWSMRHLPSKMASGPA